VQGFLTIFIKTLALTFVNHRLMPARQILFASFALAYSFGMQAQKKVFNQLAPKRARNASSKKGNCGAPFILAAKCFFYCHFYTIS
jgi:hypothetical protein